MTNPAPNGEALPPHIEDSVAAIARLHAEHYEDASPLQKAVERWTAKAARPEFLALLTLTIAGWIALNLAMLAGGRRPWDEPPFFWLQGAVALAALYMTLLILATQRREDSLANRRAQLALELGILSETKSAKIIELIEELRRDLPMLRNRIDPEARAMSVPADPQAVFASIKEKHEKQEGASTTLSLDTTTEAQP